MRTEFYKTEFYRAKWDSPIGKMVMVSDGEAINALWFEGQKYAGSSLPKDCIITDRRDLPLFRGTMRWLDGYFLGHEKDASEIPVRPYGTAFQLAVWHELVKIPYGETTSYGAIARKMEAQFRERGDARRVSPRSVGGAVGHNPAAILIPCHRVLGADGSLTGYAAGLARKTSLLAIEEGIGIS